MPLTILMVNQLKINKIPFCLLDEHFKNRMREIGVENFLFLDTVGEWQKKHGRLDDFYANSTYRLRVDFMIPDPMPDKKRQVFKTFIESVINIYPETEEYLIDDWKERLSPNG